MQCGQGGTQLRCPGWLLAVLGSGPSRVRQWLARATPAGGAGVGCRVVVWHSHETTPCLGSGVIAPDADGVQTHEAAWRLGPGLSESLTAGSSMPGPSRVLGPSVQLDNDGHVVRGPLALALVAVNGCSYHPRGQGR